jgi:hypothetical protein
MRVSRNEKFIKRRARLGSYATFGGLGVLMLGMIATFQVNKYPWAMWASMGALLVGFLLSQVGSYYMRRWGRTPRADQIVERELKGLDDRFHFYAWALPMPQVLLSPQGLYSIETRDQTGDISVTADRWQSKTGLARVLLAFGQEGLGNPSRDAEANAAWLVSLIQRQLPDNHAPVQPVVVFTNEKARLHIDGPTVPVLDAESLKRWLRGSGKGEPLKTADYRAIEAVLDAQAGDVETGTDATPEKRQKRTYPRKR